MENNIFLIVGFSVLFLLELVERIRERAIGFFVTRYMYFFWLTVLCVFTYNIWENWDVISPQLGLTLAIIYNIVILFASWSYMLLRGLFLFGRYLAIIGKKDILSDPKLQALSLHPRKTILWALVWSLVINLPIAVMTIWALCTIQ